MQHLCTDPFNYYRCSKQREREAQSAVQPVVSRPVIPRQPGKSAGWIIDYDFLSEIQAAIRCRHCPPEGGASLEQIEAVVLELIDHGFLFMDG